MLGPVPVDVNKIFVGDAAEPPAQLAGDRERIEPGVIAHDGLDCIDVVRDQLGRHLLQVGGMLDDAAQALGRRSGSRKAESGGIALDVMGGTEQLAVGILAKTFLEDRGMCGREPSASANIQSLNSPERSASAFSARATGSSASCSLTRRSTLRSGLGWVMT